MRSRRQAALGIALSSWLSAASARAESAADVAQARDLFRQAAALANQERWAEARDLYARSLQLKSAPITMYSLAVAEMSSGDLVEALESFRSFLRATDASTAQYDGPAKQAILDMEPRIAHAIIVVEPADATGLDVTLNGVAVPAAALGLERPVNPGTLGLAARADGHALATETREVAPGGSIRIVLRLVRAARGAAAHGADPKGAPEAAREGALPRPLPWILIGAGGGVAVLGGVLGGVALSDAGSATTEDGPEADSARSKALIADVAIGIGVAATATGTVLLLLSSSGSDGRTEVAPVVAPGFAYASARLWF